MERSCIRRAFQEKIYLLNIHQWIFIENAWDDMDNMDENFREFVEAVGRDHRTGHDENGRPDYLGAYTGVEKWETDSAPESED